MEKISHSLLATFRHQLWLEHLNVLEEFSNDVAYIFVLEEYNLMYWQIENLRRQAPFNITMLYIEGNKRLCLTILKDR